MNTLDQWEAYSHLTHYRYQMEQDKPELNRRIRKLINLIRKKDEDLQLILSESTNSPDGTQLSMQSFSSIAHYAREGLDFTKKLK